MLQQGPSHIVDEGVLRRHEVGYTFLKKTRMPVQYNTTLSIYLSISIYRIYIAPLQGNCSEALPAQAWAKWKVLRRP